MKISINILITIIFAAVISSCTTSRKMQPSTTTAGNVEQTIPDKNDSNLVNAGTVYLKGLEKNSINFNTFSGKAKVQFEDKNGRQPDAIATIRMQKDSIIWISLSSTFLNIEAVRIMITPDTLMLINKLEKTADLHPFSYIQNLAQFPLTFSMLQDILIGNPILVGDSIDSFYQTPKNIFIETGQSFFKNLLSLNADNHFLEKSKIEDTSPGSKRVALLEYGDYSQNNEPAFATYRALMVPDNSKIDLRIAFREFEFNKELSYPFNIPGNYKTN